MQSLIIFVVCIILCNEICFALPHKRHHHIQTSYKRPTSWYSKQGHSWEGYGRQDVGKEKKIQTVADVASAYPDLSTLVTAVKAAGLVDTLNGEGPFTVFAPNNDAFAKVPEDTLADLLKPENLDQLKEILLRHVLPTLIVSEDIPEGSTTVDTAGGETITVINSDGINIESSAGTATVIKADVPASNGVIHIVDTVF